MKLADRFQSLTPHELQRAIDTREHLIVKSRSEIRVLEKLKAAKVKAADAAAKVAS